VKRKILPIGSFEQHGPHLPLETDSLIAEKISRELSRNIQADLLETIKVSCSDEHADFSGTKSISGETFEELIIKVLKKELNSTQQLIVFNAHGGNSQILKKIARSNPEVLFLDLFETIKGHLIQTRDSSLGGICHAGEFETSLMMYLFPSLVRVQEIKPEIVTLVPELDPDFDGNPPKTWKTIKFSKSGVLGDPTKATKSKGEAWFKIIIKECLNRINC